MPDLSWWQWALIIIIGYGVFTQIIETIQAKSNLIEKAELKKREAIASEKKALENKEKAKLKKEEAKVESQKTEQRRIQQRQFFLNKISQLAEKSPDVIEAKGNNKVRNWFGAVYAEVQSLFDNYNEEMLKKKKNPALKAAQQVKATNKEKKELNQKLKVLEYQLKTYEQYFPIIEDFKDYILEEGDSFIIQSDGSIGNDDDIDPSKKFLSPEEFKALPLDQKNQLALERYLNRNHSKLEIGRFYERYLGYLYEQEGWVVKFKGIIDGFDDLGRDLVCKKGNEILIIQAKNWSRKKIIREKYIYQHFATTTHFRLTEKIRKKDNVKSVFISTIDYSDMAKKVAKALDVELKTVKFDKDYPMIKCNINPTTNEKIFHLPFDQQYDKIIIGNNEGESYQKTVADAVNLGFRRAYRYRGPA